MLSKKKFPIQLRVVWPTLKPILTNCDTGVIKDPFYFQLQRLIIAGYSLFHCEVQSLEEILNEIDQNIQCETNKENKKLILKILLEPGTIVTTTDVARRISAPVVRTISAMMALHEKQLGYFEEIRRSGTTIKQFRKHPREIFETNLDLTRILAEIVKPSDYFASLEETEKVRKPRYNFKFILWFCIVLKISPNWSFF